MIQGDLQPDFHLVARTFAQQLRRSSGGAAVCVYHDGVPVVDLWGGQRNDAGDPWERDTTSMSFSTTKGVMSTLIHVLVDRGEIDLDAPVAHYWPEFAAAGKGRVTVRQLMCHEAGLHGIRYRIDDAREMLDFDHMSEVLAAAEPAYEPGSANGYHGLTYGWLVGELARRVTGKPVPELLETELAGPLGLDGLYCGIPEDAMPRAAQLMLPDSVSGDPSERLYKFAKFVQRTARALRLPLDPGRTADALVPHGMGHIDWSAKETRAASIPAANGHFTARSLARLYACLAAGGQLDGVELMRPETVERASQVQNRRVDLVVPLPMHWRLGYHRVFSTRGSLPRGFGHFGFGGSGGFADPERKLGVALVVNSGVGTPFGDARIAQIAGAVLKSLKNL